jgi:hypothetical protein
MALKRGNPNWVKDTSGNPGGRGKVDLEIRDLCRAHTVDTVKRLVEIAKQSDSDQASVAAIKELHDRGWGRPQQTVTMDVKGDFLKLLAGLAEGAADAPGVVDQSGSLREASPQGHA